MPSETTKPVLSPFGLYPLDDLSKFSSVFPIVLMSAYVLDVKTLTLPLELSLCSFWSFPFLGKLPSASFVTLRSHPFFFNRVNPKPHLKSFGTIPRPSRCPRTNESFDPNVGAVLSRLCRFALRLFGGRLRRPVEPPCERRTPIFQFCLHGDAALYPQGPRGSRPSCFECLEGTSFFDDDLFSLASNDPIDANP